jgi:hypothetical protein
MMAAKLDGFDPRPNLLLSIEIGFRLSVACEFSFVRELIPSFHSQVYDLAAELEKSFVIAPDFSI